MAEINDGRIILGTEIKLNIHIDPFDGLSMDDYDFQCAVFTASSRRVVITKQETKRIDEDNYLIMVSTDALGAGKLKCEVTAQIPDADFNDGIRTEIALFDTGLVISKSI